MLEHGAAFPELMLVGDVRGERITLGIRAMEQAATEPPLCTVTLAEQKTPSAVFAGAFADRGLTRLRNPAHQDFARSLADFNGALRVDPNCSLAYSGRALLRAACPDARFRDGCLALTDAQRANKLAARDLFWPGPSANAWQLSVAAARAAELNHRVNLAQWALTCAQAESGDFRSAVQTLTRLMERDPPFDTPHTLGQIRASFEKGTKFRYRTGEREEDKDPGRPSRPSHRRNG